MNFLQLYKADADAAFLDLNLSVNNDSVLQKKTYDKRDGFDIVNFPFLDGDIPRRPSYGIFISPLIRFARASSHVSDFNSRNKFLSAKAIGIINSAKHCPNFTLVTLN